MGNISGPFKASKSSDNRQRRTLSKYKRPLISRGQNAREAEQKLRIEEVLRNSKDVATQFRRAFPQDALDFFKNIKK